MQRTHQVRTPNRTTRWEGEDTAAQDEMLALPRWESFPLEQRQHLVCLMLHTARRQVATRPVPNHPSR